MIFSMFISLLAACLVMWVAWICYLFLQNPGVVDLFWGLACFSVAVILLCFVPHWGVLHWIAFIGVLLWAIRLCGYLAVTRVFKGHRDPRYDALSQNWQSQAIGFLVNYTFQGVLAWLVAMPPFLMLLSGKITVGIWQWIGVGCFLLGLVGETIADFQLRHFKQSGHGLICQTGLWRYSRHPNYYFEWLVWMSFAMISVTTYVSLLGFIGPMVLFVVMFFVTGPMTERQSIAKHGAVFKAYQNRTSYFFLWFSTGKG